MHRILCSKIQSGLKPPFDSLLDSYVSMLAEDTTADGELPPWEIAKAYAFHVVIQRMSATLEKPAHFLHPLPPRICHEHQRKELKT